LCKHSLPTLTK
jgi:hypothetical protein